MPHIREADRRERIEECLAVGIARSAKERIACITAQFHQFSDAQIVGAEVFLWQIGDAARKRAPADAGNGLSIQRHLSGNRLQEPHHRFEKGGLSAAVRPHKSGETPMGETR